MLNLYRYDVLNTLEHEYRNRNLARGGTSQLMTPIPVLSRGRTTRFQELSRDTTFNSWFPYSAEAGRLNSNFQEHSRGRTSELMVPELIKGRNFQFQKLGRGRTTQFQSLSRGRTTQFQELGRGRTSQLKVPELSKGRTYQLMVPELSRDRTSLLMISELSRGRNSQFQEQGQDYSMLRTKQRQKCSILEAPQRQEFSTPNTGTQQST